VESAVARIPDPAKDPQGFAAWKRGSQLGAEKLVEITKPVVGKRTLGDRVETRLPTRPRAPLPSPARPKWPVAGQRGHQDHAPRPGMQDQRAKESNKTQLLV
jgi:hypothetical protein